MVLALHARGQRECPAVSLRNNVVAQASATTLLRYCAAAAVSTGTSHVGTSPI